MKAAVVFLPQLASSFTTPVIICNFFFFCLINQFNDFVSQDAFLKIVCTCRTLTFLLQSTSFRVVLDAMLIWRVAEVCLFMVLLWNLVLCGSVIELYISVDCRTTVMWRCACNHGYCHFSVHFSWYVTAVTLLGFLYFCLIFEQGAFEIEVLHDIELLTISSLSDFVKRGYSEIIQLSCYNLSEPIKSWSHLGKSASSRLLLTGRAGVRDNLQGKHLSLR